MTNDRHTGTRSRGDSNNEEDFFPRLLDRHGLCLKETPILHSKLHLYDMFDLLR